VHCAHWTILNRHLSLTKSVAWKFFFCPDLPCWWEQTILFLFFWWHWGLVLARLARQALYHLSHAASPGTNHSHQKVPGCVWHSWGRIRSAQDSFIIPWAWGQTLGTEACATQLACLSLNFFMCRLSMTACAWGRMWGFINAYHM
jgi:hypothetical protein